MKALLAAAVLAFVAGCASEEQKAAEPEKAPAGRDLVISVGSEGTVLLASGTQATLRIVNIGAEPLSVCDDNQCMLVDPGKDLELPVSGRVTFHITVAGDGAGKAEAHLTGGGEKAALAVQ